MAEQPDAINVQRLSYDFERGVVQFGFTGVWNGKPLNISGGMTVTPLDGDPTESEVRALCVRELKRLLHDLPKSL